MKRQLAFFAALLLFSAVSTASVAADSQVYEVRSYILGEKGDAAAIDSYLEKALIPALNRQGIASVGVFANAANDESGVPRIVVAIPYDSADDIAKIQKAVHADQQYLAAGEDYLGRMKKNAAYQRISSELLVAMDCWPALKVPEGALKNSERVYELRLYESPSEKLGHLKVHMFNNGEVPIFLDSKIQPIFIGQAVVGPQTPSLTYLTMYENEAARLKAWDAFRAHTDWQVLKKVAKYKGTVSKNNTCIMVPKPYSQM